MTSQKQTEWLSCWCYARKKQVNVKGFIVGKRQAELLEVTNCSELANCPKSCDITCLLNKIREGKW